MLLFHCSFFSPGPLLCICKYPKIQTWDLKHIYSQEFGIRSIPYPIYMPYSIYICTKVITYSAPHCVYYYIIFFLLLPPVPPKPPPRTSFWPQYTLVLLKLYQAVMIESLATWTQPLVLIPGAAVRLIFRLKPGPYNYVVSFVFILSHLPTMSYLWDHQRSPHKHKPMRPTWRTKTHVPLGKMLRIKVLWQESALKIRTSSLLTTLYIQEHEHFEVSK